jgi:hypothetical protein
VILRSALAIAIVVGALAAFHRLVVIPYRCNIVEGRVSRSTEEVWRNPESYRTRQVALRNLELMRSCVQSCPANVNLQMLEGSNLLLLQRASAAATSFERALRFDRRPELYMALGIAQLAAGVPKETAVANFVAAADFAGLDTLKQIPDAEARWSAYTIAGERRERALAASGTIERRNKVANGSFEQPGPLGRRTASSARGVSPAAAGRWDLFNIASAPITSELTKSPPGRESLALHVSVQQANSGVSQIWQGRTAPRVVTAASVYVVRGSVYLGSGNGKPPMANAYSRSTGSWEQLTGTNISCPAYLTVIYAATSEGAEFYVEDVTVTETLAAPPCEN